MAARTQAYRHILLSTPLGEDELLLGGFTYQERLGRPFQMTLRLTSDNPRITFQELIGENVTVTMSRPNGEPRFFNGYVSRFSQGEWDGTLATYQAEVVPWVWLLSQTADCRIFQAMTVPEIVMQIFRDSGFTDFEDRLQGDYAPWEYCVQYRETDLHFVSRLMEQVGMYFFFTHENGKHTLILADNLGCHEPMAGYEQISYHPPTEAVREGEYIHDWRIEQEFQPGRYTHDDFDFKNPKKDLLAAATGPLPTKGTDFEIFDYPGEYVETSPGQDSARKRIEEIQSDLEVVSGRTNARGMSAGHKFELEIPSPQAYPRDDQAREYLTIATTISAESEAFESGVGGGSARFECSFSAIAAEQQYRSPRVTPKPVIRGPQTAIVTGPSGDEICTDEHGRIKVQFHWDRYGQANAESSCWIRVAQLWAGKKWGAMYVPRIGQEVIVEFLEGDPDRPIVVGRVYNGEAMPPYDLPSKATMSTIKSNSSKGGGGFNEIRFEDKKGSEQIFIHAQMDEDLRVLNDSREWIGNERHMIVKKSQLEKVELDKHLTVTGNQNEKVDGTVSLTTGMDLQQKIGMKHAVDAGMEIHLKAGMNVVIEAGLSITLKAGGGFIVVGPTGVTISGKPVLINSGGSAGSGSGCNATSPKDPKEAASAEAGSVDEPAEPPEPPEPIQYGSQSMCLITAAENASPFCEISESSQATEETSAGPGQSPGAGLPPCDGGSDQGLPSHEQ